MAGFQLAGAAVGANDALQEQLAIAYKKLLDNQRQANTEKAAAEQSRQFDVTEADRQTQMGRQAKNDEFGRAKDTFDLLQGQPEANLGAGQDPLTPHMQADPNFVKIPDTFRRTVDFGDGVKLTPQSDTELAAKAKAADAAKVREVPLGGSLVQDGKTVYQNAKPEVTDYKPEDVLVDGKPTRIKTDQKTAQAFNVDTGEPIASSRIQRAPTPRDPNVASDAQTRSDEGRNDRSFQASQTRLDALRKPIADRADRLDRLETTINQRTPQADSLIAPELVTVIAGGAGSGVRITTAEIESVLGGRSKLESLKAALNKWSLDPSKALAITDDQRAQIQALLSEVRTRSHRDLDALDTATDKLISAKSPEEHRRIVADAQKTLTGGGTPKTGGGELHFNPATGKIEGGGGG